MFRGKMETMHYLDYFLIGYAKHKLLPQYDSGSKSNKTPFSFAKIKNLDNTKHLQQQRKAGTHCWSEYKWEGRLTTSYEN